MTHLQSLARTSRALDVMPSQAELAQLAEEVHAVMARHGLAVAPFQKTHCRAKLEIGASGVPQAVIECRLVLAT